MYRWAIIEEFKTVPFSNKKYYFHYLIYVSLFNSAWTCILIFKLNSPKLVGKKYIKEIIDNLDYYLVGLSKSVDEFNYILNMLNNDPKKFINKYTCFNDNYKIYNITVPISQDLCDKVDKKLFEYFTYI